MDSSERMPETCPQFAMHKTETSSVHRSRKSIPNLLPSSNYLFSADRTLAIAWLPVDLRKTRSCVQTTVGLPYFLRQSFNSVPLALWRVFSSQNCEGVYQKQIITSIRNERIIMFLSVGPSQADCLTGYWRKRPCVR
ncbi:hypothetical protein BaRGS_00035421 [Batillaria attramentaria]|uniref:Uncharacterized protein n=1 Tax=Batillaria attramentaria TaxID=370345 RepID=A0ABD0JEY7_9CAEN